MKSFRSSRAPPTEEAGGGPAWRPSWGYLAAALGIVAGGIAFLLASPPAPTSADADDVAAAAPAVATPAPATIVAAVDSRNAALRATTVAERSPPDTTATTAAAAAPRIPRMREPDSDQTPDLADYVNPGETPTMAEVIDRLHLAGVYGGLGAFSPPGTRPPLVGLAVPEDFELPAGYVRHYQVTDDGQRIEPILMFSPDRPVVDAAGTPMTIPDDRVVPPELAPPGLPLRRIVVPAPVEARRPGR